MNHEYGSDTERELQGPGQSPEQIEPQSVQHLEPTCSTRQIVDLIWPLSDTLVAISKHVKQFDWATVAEWDEELASFMAAHETFVREELGLGGALDEWYELNQSFAASQDMKVVQKILDQVFETGLCKEWPPLISLRSRETLLSALSFLEQQTKFDAIIDLGCGDGRIGVGVSLCNSLVRTVVAIDNLKSALELAQRHIDTLSEPQHSTASSKVTLMKADYAALPEHPLLNNDQALILAAYSCENLETLLTTLKDSPLHSNPVLAYFPYWFEGGMVTPAMMFHGILGEAAEIAESAGYRAQIIDYGLLHPSEIYVGFYLQTLA